MSKAVLIAVATSFLLVVNFANAETIISEFEPNPGTGSSISTIELVGVAGSMFDVNVISIENDGFNGVVDRATNVTGVFDANGIAVFDVPDLENPSFTLLLTEFLVATGTDLDVGNTGILDVSGIGAIFDAVGVSDSVGDNATLYSTALGGSDILFNGFDEPLGVFREGSDGDFFQYVLVDAGLATERVGVFSADGASEIDVAEFAGDPTTTSFGLINPTFAVPEPSTFAFVALVGFGASLRRRRA